LGHLFGLSVIEITHYIQCRQVGGEWIRISLTRRPRETWRKRFAERLSSLTFMALLFGKANLSATKILWGQVTVISVIVLVAIWAATQRTAWRLGFQPELGQPWFQLARGVPVYPPPAFFWWWYAYDAYAPTPPSTTLSTSSVI
jgi:hypothetical protein